MSDTHELLVLKCDDKYLLFIIILRAIFEDFAKKYIANKEDNEAKHKEIQMKIKHKHTSSSIHYFVSENNSSEIKGAILFNHPVFADHRIFDEQVNFFSANYKVITLALLGHGLSQGLKDFSDIAYLIKER